MGGRQWVVRESLDVKRVGKKWALFGSDRQRMRSKATLSVSVSSWSSSSLASVGGCASRRSLNDVISWYDICIHMALSMLI